MQLLAELHNKLAAGLILVKSQEQKAKGILKKILQKDRVSSRDLRCFVSCL